MIECRQHKFTKAIHRADELMAQLASPDESLAKLRKYALTCRRLMARLDAVNNKKNELRDDWYSRAISERSIPLPEFDVTQLSEYHTLSSSSSHRR